MRKEKILKKASVLTILAIIILNTFFVFTPMNLKANSMIQTENTSDPTSVTFDATGSCGYIEWDWISYSDARNSNGGIIDTTFIEIGQQDTGSVFHISRGFVFFDTSSIPDSATIDSAVLSLYGHQDLSAEDFSIIVQNGQPTYPHDPLVENDYNRDHYSGNGGSFNTNSFITDGYNDINLNSDGKSWINKEGTTKFCLRNDNEINNNAPEKWIYEIVRVKLNAKLTVEYTNQAPNKPQQPYGSTNCEPNVEYTFRTSTTDPEGDQVLYQWRWGDGTQTNWLGPFNSGEEATATKSWNAKGTYSITVKAKDVNDAESVFSEPLSITVKKNKAIDTPMFLQWLFQRFPFFEKILNQLI